MTSIAVRLRASPFPARLVAAWEAVAARFNPITVIVVAWAVLAVPLIFFRGYFSHEGLAVSIARTGLDTGDWLTPYLYNVRFVERPTLQSWIIEAISLPFGGVNQITARLPSALFLLAGCLLIYALLRRLTVGVAAALLGAALFLACPLVLRSYVLVTADLPLAVLLFAAFYVWWGGEAHGRISLARWFGIGVVLAFAGLLKGPQPLGYFALGIGVYSLATRSWRQIPGLILAGVICALPLAAWYAAIYAPGDEVTWGAFMRVKQPREVFASPLPALLKILVDVLPALLLALLLPAGRALGEKSVAPPRFFTALACFAFIAPLFILFWPAGSTSRYYLPLVLPLCVFGALGYDMFSRRRPELVAPGLIVTAVLLVYALGYAAAAPLLPERFRQSQLDGAHMAALVQAAPAPIFWAGDVGLNILPYVPGHIRYVSLEDLRAMPGPAWIVVSIADAETLAAQRPGKMHIVAPLGDQKQWRLVRLDG